MLLREYPRVKKEKLPYVKPELMKFGSVASVTGSGKDESNIDFKNGEFCLTPSSAKTPDPGDSCNP